MQPLKGRAIFVQFSGTVGSEQKTDIKKTIRLIGVRKLQLAAQHGVGKAAGLSDFFLQPWYFREVGITIGGKSYIGAYFSDFFNPTRDATVNDMKELLSEFNNSRGNASREFRFIIENEDSFTGFVESFTYSEDIGEPFILDYTVNIVARRDPATATENGFASAAKDLAIATVGAAPVLGPIFATTRSSALL